MSIHVPRRIEVSDTHETKRARCRYCVGARVFFKAIDPDNALRWLWICLTCRQPEGAKTC